MGLVLDTSIAIFAERREQSPQALIDGLNSAFEPTFLAMSSVTVVELTHGIYRAKTQQQEDRRRAFATELFLAVPIVPLTFEIAQLAGRIEGQQAAKGIRIEFQDLAVAATAVHLGFDVLTLNVRHFGMIPGLRVITF